MDALAFFRLRYEPVHGSTTGRLLELDPALLRARPHGLNSIAWLFWHLARCEDVGVNRLVVDRAQVLDEEGWPARLGVPRRDIGSGMTGPEVDELSASIDLAALRGYWDAVGRRTVAVLETLSPDDLDAPIDRDRLARSIAEEGVLGPAAAWVGDFWATWPNRGAALAQLALAHHWGHIYDAITVRGLLGIPGR